jgi:hypothetical protein
MCASFGVHSGAGCAMVFSSVFFAAKRRRVGAPVLIAE